MVFSILRMVTMPRNLVEILIKNSAFCLNQILKVICVRHNVLTAVNACFHESRSQKFNIITENAFLS